MCNNLTRYIINFFLSGILVLLFRAFGWIDFVRPSRFVEDQLLNDLLVAGIIALVLFIVGEILGFVFKIIKTVFFFAGCLLSIIYFFVSGYIKLALAAWILTDWFVYSKSFLVVLIMVTAIGFVRLPHRDEMSKEEREFLQWKKRQQ